MIFKRNSQASLGKIAGTFVTDLYKPNSIYSIDRARLIEENIRYDDLAVQENFSDDEISEDLSRALLEHKKERKALIKAKFLKQ